MSCNKKIWNIPSLKYTKSMLLFLVFEIVISWKTFLSGDHQSLGETLLMFKIELRTKNEWKNSKTLISKSLFKVLVKWLQFYHFDLFNCPRYKSKKEKLYISETLKTFYYTWTIFKFIFTKRFNSSLIKSKFEIYVTRYSSI